MGIHLQLGCKEKSGLKENLQLLFFSLYQPKFDYITTAGFSMLFQGIYPYLSHERAIGSSTQSSPYFTPYYLLLNAHGPSQRVH